MEMSGFELRVKLAAFLILQSVTCSQGRSGRCYTCRSRGELGDCKDPFVYNATSAEEVKGVEISPCASGWCAKIIEGGSDDFDTATERMCVQRQPIDGVERCSETIVHRRPVHMCFCMGDLCNQSPRIHSLSLPLLPVIALILVCCLKANTAC